MSKLVRKRLADSPMARKRKLAELAERPDSEIDFSDIPPLDDSFWQKAVRNPYYRPNSNLRCAWSGTRWLGCAGRGEGTRPD